MEPFSLVDFITESNAIEGIFRTVGYPEMSAYREFLSETPTVESLQKLVSVVQPGAELREHQGMNVSVGNHRPPMGGLHIRYLLESLLDLKSPDAHKRHLRYEDLHPFMDGNGRSGRALWLHDMGGIYNAPLGFLHMFYYQTLQKRSREVIHV